MLLSLRKSLPTDRRLRQSRMDGHRHYTVKASGQVLTATKYFVFARNPSADG
ncbi:MAG: hypothetical protein IIB40_07575 [Candidatus Marinimicrobia bacterium]|nr:hypothetical protein [Candidatus Neomarinimicrobiota bacterium]